MLLLSVHPHTLPTPCAAQACALAGDRVYRLAELVEQQAGWREKRARPEVEEVVGAIRQASRGPRPLPGRLGNAPGSFKRFPGEWGRALAALPPRRSCRSCHS